MSATKRPSLHALLTVVLLSAASPLRPPDALATGPRASAVNSIETFVECLNLIKVGKGTVADAVRCVPPDCFFSVLRSFSAQASCEIAGCVLPRVIFDCPGTDEGLRFRPSFLLCPLDSVRAGGQLGTNRIEVGEDVTADHVQIMADVPLPPRTTDFSTLTTDAVLSTASSNKGCNGCHAGLDPATDAAGNILSRPIFPFAGNVLDTNEPGVTPGAPDPMTLDEICECIEDNIDAIDTDPGRQILIQLCRRLVNKTRDVGPDAE